MRGKRLNRKFTMFRKICQWFMVVCSITGATCNANPETVLSKSQLDSQKKSIENELANIQSSAFAKKDWHEDYYDTRVHEMNDKLNVLKTRFDKYLAVQVFSELFSARTCDEIEKFSSSFLVTYYKIKHRIFYGHKTTCEICKTNWLE